MKIALRLSYNDGTAEDVVCNAADFVAFEREFDVSVTTVDSKIGNLLWLAWHSLTRVGKTSLEFDAWLNLVDTVAGSESDPK